MQGSQLKAGLDNQGYHIVLEQISKFVKKLAYSYESMFVMNTKRNFQTILKLRYFLKMLDKHYTLFNYFRTKIKQTRQYHYLSFTFLCKIASKKELPSSYICLTQVCLIISFNQVDQTIRFFNCSGLIANQPGKWLINRE